MRWVSSEFRATVGVRPDENVGIGEHLLSSRTRYPVRRESGERWTALTVPYMLGTGQDRAALAAMTEERLRPVVAAAEPAPPPPLWTFDLHFVRFGRIRGLAVRGGEAPLTGVLFLYGTSLPASLLQLVTRGDLDHFRRTAALVEPGRRAAAVLFADLEGSTAVSRRLPTARFFAMVRELMTAMDGAVIGKGGVVGKHGGDGAVGFFLAEQLGSASAAARAAVAAGRAIAEAGRALGVAVDVGLHWGETLYLGQVTTGGRLEVTALGDEVNECARVQESATGGVVLATKALVERLDAADAAALGLDVGALAYAVLADLPGAGRKAVRDAGTLPVAEVDG